MPDLVNTNEAAELLGVTPRRVRALRQHRADFPAPVVTRRALMLWDRDAIEEWGRTADRSRGRRHTQREEQR